MEVLKLCVVQGVQACNLGVPILAEEFEVRENRLIRPWNPGIGISRLSEIGTSGDALERRATDYAQSATRKQSGLPCHRHVGLWPVGTVRGIDASLQAGEALVVAAVGIANGCIFIQFMEGGGAGIVDFMDPEFSFHAGQPSQEPVGADERIDEEALDRRDGLAILAIAPGEGSEPGRVFSGNDLGFGDDTGLERADD